MPSQTILVVEDEQLVALDLQLLLEKCGYTVIEATDGAAALKLALEQQPNLVLMDINIAGAIDGISLAEAIQAQMDIPIVFLTAYTDESLRRRAAVIKPYGYLLKPYDERALRDTIELGLLRHERESRIRARERWFTTALTHINDAVITTDEQARIVYLNDAAVRLLRITPGSAIGRQANAMLSLFDSHSREPLAHPVQDLLNSDGPANVSHDGLLLMANRNLVRVTFSAAQITTETNQILGVVIILQDKTPQERAVEERRVRERQVEEIGHLERLRLLSAGAAHDLNNMLTALGGQIELAQLDLDDRAGVVISLFQMQRITRRAADLARYMLAYSSPRSNAYQMLDLNTLVNETLAALRPAQLRLCTVEVQPGALPMVEGNAMQIQQIVLNLLVNAAEAVGQFAGVIKINTESLLLSEPRLFPGGLSLPAGQYVALRVRDNGVGMDEKTKDRIFEPFFSTKPSGHGLGLAAVMEHIRGHNGAIEVESAPGEGTLMTMLLPTNTTRMLQQKELPIDKPTVLVIEDDHELRKLVEQMVEYAGYRALSASDGPGGMAIFQQQIQQIKCALINQQLPGMSGTEVAELIRALRPKLPIIMMTGYNNEEMLNFFAQVARLHYLGKPFTINELGRRLHEVLAA